MRPVLKTRSVAVDVIAAPKDSSILNIPPVHVEYVPEDISGRPQCFTVKGSWYSSYDPDVVYALLTDYQNSTAVFRNILRSEVASSEEPGILHVSQTCQWNFLAFSGTFDARFSINEDAQNKVLVFKLLESSFMKDFEGRWQVRVEEVGDSGITSSFTEEIEGAPRPDRAEFMQGETSKRAVSALQQDRLSDPTLSSSRNREDRCRGRENSQDFRHEGTTSSSSSSSSSTSFPSVQQQLGGTRDGVYADELEWARQSLPATQQLSHSSISSENGTGFLPASHRADSSGSCADSSAVKGIRSRKRICVVEHVLSVQPSLPVPPPISFYTRSIFVKQVRSILADLEAEVGRRHALN